MVPYAVDEADYPRLSVSFSAHAQHKGYIGYLRYRILSCCVVRTAVRTPVFKIYRTTTAVTYL